LSRELGQLGPLLNLIRVEYDRFCAADGLRIEDGPRPLPLPRAPDPSTESRACEVRRGSGEGRGRRRDTAIPIEMAQVLDVRVQPPRDGARVQIEGLASVDWARVRSCAVQLSGTLATVQIYSRAFHELSRRIAADRPNLAADLLKVWQGHLQVLSVVIARIKSDKSLNIQLAALEKEVEGVDSECATAHERLAAAESELAEAEAQARKWNSRYEVLRDKLVKQQQREQSLLVEQTEADQTLKHTSRAYERELRATADTGRRIRRSQSFLSDYSQFDDDDDDDGDDDDHDHDDHGGEKAAAELDEEEEDEEQDNDDQVQEEDNTGMNEHEDVDEVVANTDTDDKDRPGAGEEDSGTTANGRDEEDESEDENDEAGDDSEDAWMDEIRSESNTWNENDDDDKYFENDGAAEKHHGGAKAETESSQDVDEDDEFDASDWSKSSRHRKSHRPGVDEEEIDPAEDAYREKPVSDNDGDDFDNNNFGGRSGGAGAGGLDRDAYDEDEEQGKFNYAGDDEVTSQAGFDPASSSGSFNSYASDRSAPSFAPLLFLAAMVATCIYGGRRVLAAAESDYSPVPSSDFVVNSRGRRNKPKTSNGLPVTPDVVRLN